MTAACLCVLTLASCSAAQVPASDGLPETEPAASGPVGSGTSGRPGGAEAPARKTLVAYFSATGTTRALAQYAAEIMDADLYEIVPEIPYTDADLAYYTNGRADREQNDPAARPGISGGVADMDGYDVILLGYPIWHGKAPRVISTFLESYDFTGKTIVPFCTSHSSGIGSSCADLHALAGAANWLAGQRFAGGTARSAMEEWISGLNLPEPAAGIDPGEKEASRPTA